MSFLDRFKRPEQGAPEFAAGPTSPLREASAAMTAADAPLEAEAPPEKEVAAAAAPLILEAEMVLETEALRSELSKMQSSSDEKIRALTAERDALLQQKAHLAQQLNDLTRKGGLKSYLTDAAAPSPNAQPQRQVSELQRRIAILEHSQRDTALELQRERESKIKLDRQLTNSDRLRQDTAIHVEEAHASMRREFETTVRKRDAESARALKEAQEQIEIIKASKTRVVAELEQARARLATEATAPAPATALETCFEERVIAQFEADIESYRDRIKALLQERDALAGAVQNQLADLQERLAVVLRERDEARAFQSEPTLPLNAGEVARLATQLESERERYSAEIVRLRVEFERLTQERNVALAEGEKLLAEIDAIEARQQQAVGQTERERDAFTRGQHEAAAQIATLQQQLATTVAERDKLAVQASSPTASETATEQRPPTGAGQVVAESELGAALKTAQEKIAALTRDRNRLAAERQALLAEAEARNAAPRTRGTDQFKPAKEMREDALAWLEAEDDHKDEERSDGDAARLRRERDGVIEQRDALRARVEQLLQEQRQLREELARTSLRDRETLSEAPAATKPAAPAEPRRARETKVIDISTAEVVTEPAEGGHGLKIQRIRPVAIPPPQVRVR